MRDTTQALGRCVENKLLKNFTSRTTPNLNQQLHFGEKMFIEGEKAVLITNYLFKMFITLHALMTHLFQHLTLNFMKPNNAYNHLFCKTFEWATTNNLLINSDKNTAMLFTPDPSEQNRILSLELTIYIIKHYPHQNTRKFQESYWIQNLTPTTAKAKRTLNIFKPLTSTERTNHFNF